MLMLFARNFEHRSFYKMATDLRGTRKFSAVWSFLQGILRQTLLEHVEMIIFAAQFHTSCSDRSPFTKRSIAFVLILLVHFPLNVCVT